MTHRVLWHKVVAFAQKLVQDMAELPGGDSVLLQRLPDGDGPESVAAIGMIRSDDGGADVLRLHRRLERVERLAHRYRQLGVLLIS